MSTQSLAAVSSATLADAIDSALAAGLAGRDENCAWCGASAVVVDDADIWSGHVKLKCTCCGSELAGVVPRQLREVRR